MNIELLLKLISEAEHEEEDLYGDDPNEGCRDHLVVDGHIVHDGRCFICRLREAGGIKLPAK